MYTNINILFVLLWKLWPASIQDILRANSLIIACTVSYFWVTGTFWEWYVEKAELPPVTKYFHKYSIFYVSIIADIIIHVLPVIILGIPFLHPLLSFCGAAACFLSWYFAVRRDNEIQKIYRTEIPIKTCDMIIVWGVCLAMFMAVAIEYYSRTY
jgi:hypothetical protein